MKKCHSCRKSLPANASYCYDCTAKSIGLDNISKYQDIGGWLLFFMVLAVISIVIGLVTAFRGIGDLSTLKELEESVATLSIPDAAFNLLTINLIMAFVILVLNIIYVAQVFGRKSRFLFFYQLASILGLLTGILSLIALNMVEGASGSGEVIWNMLLATSGLLLFTLYYSSSVRVRVYMDNDEYFTKAIFTFKNKDDAFLPENTLKTAPTWQSHVSTDSTCEGCKGKYAATHDSCPHCNHDR